MIWSGGPSAMVPIREGERRASYHSRTLVARPTTRGVSSGAHVSLVGTKDDIVASCVGRPWRIRAVSSGIEDDVVAWVVPGPDDVVAWWSVMDEGRWTMDDGRWTIVAGAEDVVLGPSSSDVVLGPVTPGVSSGIWTISSRGGRESPEIVGIARNVGGPEEVLRGII